MKLTTAFLDKYRDVAPKWGYGALGEVVYQRTYSRPLPTGGNEKWWQTVQRVVEGVYYQQMRHCDQNGLPWSANKAQMSAQKMYDLIFNFKFLPPGRGLWAMGTEYVRQRGSAALNNCAFISTEDIKRDPAYPFCWLMDMSMLGVGVGSDTLGADTVLVKEPTNEPFVYTVADSREGWVDSLRTIINAWTGKGDCASFNYSELRPAGAPLMGFGGHSAGASPLLLLHTDLTAFFQKRVGKLLTSVDIVDIFNMVGRAVVSGGIRRTAEIMMGRPDDAAFLSMKDPTLYADELRNFRWASNNSIIAPVGLDYTQYVDQILTNGEPGFFWQENARTRRRWRDPRGNWDQYIMGQNPCGEIALESGEFCNLVEVYPAAHNSLEEFLTTLKYAYLYAKSVSLIPTHNLQTNAIIGRNRRLGVSVSGVQQAIQKHGMHAFFQTYLDKGYDYLRQIDNTYSKWLCIPQSIKLTTVKPSGTVSLLTGATPGVHFPHSEYYIRNVRFDPLSPLLPLLAEAGYPFAPSVYGDNTTVVSFPVHEDYFVKGKANVSIWEQFEIAAQMQYWWADNSVSVTITVPERERKEVARALSMYDSRLKSVALLPLDGHGYLQAPYIEITAAEYTEMMRHIKPLRATEAAVHDTDETGCTNDTCTII